MRIKLPITRKNFKLEKASGEVYQCRKERCFGLVAIANLFQVHASSAPDTTYGRPNIPDVQLDKMVVVNYLLFESAVGFSLFEVVHQADTVGLELPEVKDAMKSLDKFGKMIQLRSFNPWT